MSDALQAMMLVGFLSIFTLVGLIPLYETGNERYAKTYLTLWVIWEVLWLGPPLFQIWTRGVMG